MGKILTHEPIERGVFNRDYTATTPTMSAWAEELQNSNEVLLLLIKRMRSDWLSFSIKMRRPWTLKDTETWPGVG